MLHRAAELGHIDVVRKMVEILSQNSGWGMNDLFAKVVRPEYEDLGEFKNVSITKKAMEGNFAITPLHLASINPEIGYLKVCLSVNQLFDIQPIILCLCFVSANGGTAQRPFDHRAHR